MDNYIIMSTGTNVMVLCLPTMGFDLSDAFKEHKVVLFGKRGSAPKCPKHSTENYATFTASNVTLLYAQYAFLQVNRINTKMRTVVLSL